MAKRQRNSVPDDEEGALIFVVDVSSFTKAGFEGSVRFEGKKVNLEFDDGDGGVFLTPAMAAKINVKKGSAVSVVVDVGELESEKLTIASVGEELRVSSAKTYYAVGRGGGAIITIRKA